MFFVDVDEVKILDMTVEDGLKLVISMGLVFPDRPLPSNEEAEAAGVMAHATAGVEDTPKKKSTRRKKPDESN